MKILVFGAHPDDVELSVGGIVAAMPPWAMRWKSAT